MGHRYNIYTWTIGEVITKNLLDRIELGVDRAVDLSGDRMTGPLEFTRASDTMRGAIAWQEATESSGNTSVTYGRLKLLQYPNLDTSYHTEYRLPKMTLNDERYLSTSDQFTLLSTQVLRPYSDDAYAHVEDIQPYHNSVIYAKRVASSESIVTDSSTHVSNDVYPVFLDGHCHLAVHVPVDTLYVKKAGDTMTGTLTFDRDRTSSNIGAANLRLQLDLDSEGSRFKFIYNLTPYSEDEVTESTVVYQLPKIYNGSANGTYNLLTSDLLTKYRGYGITNVTPTGQYHGKIVWVANDSGNDLNQTDIGRELVFHYEDYASSPSGARQTLEKFNHVHAEFPRIFLGGASTAATKNNLYFRMAYPDDDSDLATSYKLIPQPYKLIPESGFAGGILNSQYIWIRQETKSADTYQLLIPVNAHRGGIISDTLSATTLYANPIDDPKRLNIPAVYNNNYPSIGFRSNVHFDETFTNALNPRRHGAIAFTPYSSALYNHNFTLRIAPYEAANNSRHLDTVYHFNGGETNEALYQYDNGSSDSTYEYYVLTTKYRRSGVFEWPLEVANAASAIIHVEYTSPMPYERYIKRSGNYIPQPCTYYVFLTPMANRSLKGITYSITESTNTGFNVRIDNNSGSALTRTQSSGGGYWVTGLRFAYQAIGFLDNDMRNYVTDGYPDKNYVEGSGVVYDEWSQTHEESDTHYYYNTDHCVYYISDNKTQVYKARQNHINSYHTPGNDETFWWNVSEEAQYTIWSPHNTYAAGTKVRAKNVYYFRCTDGHTNIQPDNPNASVVALGQVSSVASQNWEAVAAWNSSTTYAKNRYCVYNNILFISNKASNTNHIPDARGATEYWTPYPHNVEPWSSSTIYAENDAVSKTYPVLYEAKTGGVTTATSTPPQNDDTHWTAVKSLVSPLHPY